MSRLLPAAALVCAAVALVFVAVQVKPIPRAQAGTGTVYICDKGGDEVFRERDNDDNHPALWESVTQVKKTLGPVQQDGTRSLKIEFTTPDGPFTFETVVGADGRYQGVEDVTFAGFATTVTYRGKIYYDDNNPNRPYKEKGYWYVGSDGALPDSNQDGTHQPIEFKHKCYFPEPGADDSDGDGVNRTVRTSATGSMAGTYTQQPGAQVYNVAGGVNQNIPVVDPLAFKVESDRRFNVDVVATRANSIAVTLHAELFNSDYTFVLPDELGGGEVNIPIDGDIDWYLTLNDAATEVLAMSMTLDLDGTSFEILNGATETGLWFWTLDQDPVAGTFDLATGQFTITLNGAFEAPNLMVTGAAPAAAGAEGSGPGPLQFSGELTGQVSPFAIAAAAVDNCPDVANADQLDTDADGIGDACDANFADFDCSGTTDPLDALKEAVSSLGLAVDQEAGCPMPGDMVDIDGVNVAWGDTDCNGTRDGQDAVNTLRVLSQLDIEQQDPCPLLLP